MLYRSAKSKEKRREKERIVRMQGCDLEYINKIGMYQRDADLCPFFHGHCMFSWLINNETFVNENIF